MLYDFTSSTFSSTGLDNQVEVESPTKSVYPNPMQKRFWKRKPRYVSNYADAVFRGLGLGEGGIIKL